MNKKINVQICTGTTCYVMGASELLVLEDLLPESIKENVVITGSPCFGLCCSSEKSDYSGNTTKIKKLKPPFVKISGRLIEKANPEIVIEAIKKEITGENHAHNE